MIHVLTPRSDETACGILAFDVLGRPLPEVLVDEPAQATCPVCSAYATVDARIKSEQKRLIDLGMRGDDALRQVMEALSEEEQAAWLCEPIEEFRAVRAHLAMLRSKLIDPPPHL